MNSIATNIELYNHKNGMDYIHKTTQQTRISLATNYIRESVSSTKKQKLLSVGCCTGEIETSFINMGLKVYGVDASPVALREAKKRGISTKCADISDGLPYKNNYFDFVFAGEVIEHLMRTREFLLEIKRVLKPKGFVVITTPNLGRIEDRIRFLFGKTPKHTTPIHSYLYLHIRPFTLDSLKRALVYCGFKVEKYTSNYIYLGPLKISKLSRFLANTFPGLGKTLIIMARKK